MVITTFDEGWYNAAGTHDPSNENTITGNSSGAGFNSFFAFDLAGLDKLVTKATFRVQVDTGGTFGLDPLESISLWGVSTPVATLLAGSTNAYSDLQSGISNGSFSFSPVKGSTYEITLTADAVAAINNAHGAKFALGVHLDDTAKSNEWVRFGGVHATDAISELVLEVQEPPSAVSLSNAAIAEHSATGTVVGTLSTSDPNPTDTHTYQLLSNGGGRFALAGDGASIVLVDGTSLDYEQTSAYALSVRSTDPYGASVDQSLTINVADLAHEVGSALADLLIGGPAKETLIGLAGNDILMGGAGKDVLVGGLGRDVMTGGSGADVFDFNLVKETGRTGATRDVITDFRRDIDHIDLRTIDARTDLPGNNAFGFIGFNPFSGHSGELRLKDSGSNIIVQGDRNGDGRSDFEIVVKEVATLHAGDFLL
ncbi:MAG: cadherin domain-containing protein [Microvirga sp.]